MGLRELLAICIVRQVVRERVALNIQERVNMGRIRREHVKIANTIYRGNTGVVRDVSIDVPKESQHKREDQEKGKQRAIYGRNGQHLMGEPIAI